MENIHVWNKKWEKVVLCVREDIVDRSARPELVQTRSKRAQKDTFSKSRFSSRPHLCNGYTPSQPNMETEAPPPTIALIDPEELGSALAALTLLKLVANCRSWKRSLFCSPVFAAGQGGTGGPWLGILAVPQPNSRASMGWKKHS